MWICEPGPNVVSLSQLPELRTIWSFPPAPPRMNVTGTLAVNGAYALTVIDVFGKFVPTMPIEDAVVQLESAHRIAVMTAPTMLVILYSPSLFTGSPSVPAVPVTVIRAAVARL